MLVDTYAPPVAGAEGDEASGRAPTAGGSDQRRRRLAEVERNLAVAASLLAAADRRGLSVGLLLWHGAEADDARTPGAAVSRRNRPAAWGDARGLRALARRFGLGRSPALPPHGHGVSAADDAAPPSGVGPGWLELRPERGKRHRRDLLAALAGAAANDRRDAAALTARAAASAAGDTTLVLVTAAGDTSSRHPGGPAARGRLVTIPTRDDLVARWVRFDPDLDFEEMVAPA